MWDADQIHFTEIIKGYTNTGSVEGLDTIKEQK